MPVNSAGLEWDLSDSIFDFCFPCMIYSRHAHLVKQFIIAKRSIIVRWRAKRRSGSSVPVPAAKNWLSSFNPAACILPPPVLYTLLALVTHEPVDVLLATICSNKYLVHLFCASSQALIHSFEIQLQSFFLKFCFRLQFSYNFNQIGSVEQQNHALIWNVLAYNNSETNTITVRSWLAKAENRRSTLVFCVDLAHVAALTAEFIAHGVDARFVTSDTAQKDRDERVKALMRAARVPRERLMWRWGGRREKRWRA